MGNINTKNISYTLKLLFSEIFGIFSIGNSIARALACSNLVILCFLLTYNNIQFIIDGFKIVQNSSKALLAKSDRNINSKKCQHLS